MENVACVFRLKLRGSATEYSLSRANLSGSCSVNRADSPAACSGRPVHGSTTGAGPSYVYHGAVSITGSFLKHPSDDTTFRREGEV